MVAMIEKYKVEVTKDTLVFSAAHFITYAGDKCERLHGHNYRVRVEIEGPLDVNHYVFDFIAIRNLTTAIVERLDHRVLLPTQSKLIRVTQTEQQVTARYLNRVWAFPIDDCFLLPIPNTTAELLARWIGGELHNELVTIGQPIPPITRIHVEENFGQWATCELS